MHRRLVAVLAIALCASLAAGSTAAASPIADWAFWSHYQCYDTSGGHQPPIDDRLISDRFGSRVVDIDEPETFCAGAEVLRTGSDEDPFAGNDGADLTCYDVDGGQRPNANVLVDVIAPEGVLGPNPPTEGTPAALTVEHAKTLCVPTPRGTTSETEIFPSTAEFLDQDEGFNLYYQCYSVSGGRQPSDDVRFVRDWIGPPLQSGNDPGLRVDVDQPVRLCAPANRDGDNRVNLEGAAYLCYDIDGGQTADFEHFFYNRLTLPRLDHMLLLKAESLCSPSTVQLATGTA